MSDQFDIVGTVERHRRDWRGAYHNFRSWERCYLFFQHRRINTEFELACLHLAAYLASFGMYRGSSFLSVMEYMAHKDAVLAIDKYRENLRDVTLSNSASKLTDIFSLADELTRSYSNKVVDRAATNVLVTKIMMGTLGCVPAFDRYFCLGLKRCELPQSFSRKSYSKVLEWCQTESCKFENAKRDLDSWSGRIVDYPIMRIVDIYFWQRGFEGREHG